MAKKEDIITRIAMPEQIEYAKKLIEGNDGAWRGQFDGNYYQKLFGMQAQIIVADLLGVDRPKNEKGFDGGYDVEIKPPKHDEFCLDSNTDKELPECVCDKIKIDIKTEIRTCKFRTRHFVHNVVGAQMDYAATHFLFVSCNKSTGEFEICGWIDKETFKKRAKFYPIGSERIRTDGSTMKTNSAGGLWEIKNKWLNAFTELL